MDSLLGYGSASESSGHQTAEPANHTKAPDASTTSSDDSYFGDSGSDSDDSVVQRQRAAAARLRDFGDEAKAGQGSAWPTASNRDGSNGALPQLPAAAEALTKIAGPGPSFLTPEATRPVAKSVHRQRQAPKPKEVYVPPKGRRKRGPEEDWDIASMAPKAKAEASKQLRGVISAAAVRTNTGGADSGIVTAAQVALMGGQWKTRGDGDDDDDVDDADARRAEHGRAPGAALPPSERNARSARKAPTKPMPVSDFLDRGIGGATLPRGRGDRKDREKDKRGKGQSTASHWKSEAEMVLRCYLFDYKMLSSPFSVGSILSASSMLTEFRAGQQYDS